MLINEAGVVRAIKRAYKGGGYTVNVQDGIMSIYTQNWYIQARREVMPRKVLAAIVEHAGMIPGEKEPTNIMKDMEPQLVIPETAAAEMNNWRIGERGDDVDLVPVIMQGFRFSRRRTGPAGGSRCPIWEWWSGTRRSMTAPLWWKIAACCGTTAGRP